jgi:hypothetical protein
MKPTKRSPNGTVHQKTCERCGKGFALRSAHLAKKQRFCSMACKGAASRGVPKQKHPAVVAPRECPQCRQTFQPRHLAHSQKFCSKACALKNTQRVAVEKSGAEDRSCERCGKTFRYRSTGNAGRYCSRECLYAGDRGENSPMWRGGRVTRADGYVSVYVEEEDGAKRYAPEHRVVMEKHLGRKLLPDENVHHKNGVKDDNRLENLEVWTHIHPQGQRVKDKVEFAVMILKRYRPDLLALPSGG